MDKCLANTTLGLPVDVKYSGGIIAAILSKYDECCNRAKMACKTM